MNGELRKEFLNFRDSQEIRRTGMSWDQRYMEQRVDADSIEKMRSAATIVELASPCTYDTQTIAGPMQFDRLLGCGIKSEFIGRTKDDLAALKDWLSAAEDIVLGWLCYDMKNLLEHLESSHAPAIEFPAFYFFIPDHVAICKNGAWERHSHGPFAEVEGPTAPLPRIGGDFRSISKESYMGTVKDILEHIQQGDIYETNFCASHTADDVVINPPVLFEQMLRDGMAPFSCRVAYGGKHLLCGSPERYMTKTGNVVASQPIKGTNRKQPDNAMAMQQLANDPKERAENIMITDLVRNDLSKHAMKGSVHVAELCKVYPFAHVNQMISTITCALAEGSHPLDMLVDAFPMGSMTGAPKVRAMQLMDRYEDFGRGLFSGSVGYFTPTLDFDFNVVIRSILYDAASARLSFPTGGAITINSDPEQEYEECMLKAESMRSILKAHVG